MKKKLFAIIGSPVSHSLSPILHNDWFSKYKIDANYSLLDLSNEKEIKDVLDKVRNKELEGINVTLPYKQKVIPYLDQLVNDAKSTNSVNTIFLDNNNDLDKIEEQMNKLANSAKKNGVAVGLGHARKNTLSAIERVVPDLLDKGFVFQFASQVVK